MEDKDLRLQFTAYVLLSHGFEIFEELGERGNHKIKFLSKNLSKELEKVVLPAEDKFNEASPEFYEVFNSGLGRFTKALLEYETNDLFDFMNYISKFEKL